MRVGVDLHVVDGMFQGSRTHVIELFSRVAALCPEYQFFGFLDDIESFKENYPAFNLPNFNLVHMPHSSSIKRLMWQLPKLQSQLKLDLLHTQYILPLPSLSRSMVTIHDVLFESHPEYFSAIFRLRSRIFMRLAAYQASHVFTVSNFSKNEICQRYGLADDQVSVTYNGVDFNRFYPGNDGFEFLAQRGLETGKYFLTVGRLEPRKNHVTLLRAYSQLGKSAPRLVIVGQKDFGFEALFEELIDPELRERVLIIEDVGDKELPALYRHGLAFIYPSLAEGFGMPPLEAMASGVPVIVANNTALTEVVGDAGLLVGSKDMEALKIAMFNVASNTELRYKLVEAGLKQSHTFLWEASAKIVADRYRKLAKGMRI